MVTISHVVRRIVNEKPFLQEALAREIVSYAALARYLEKEIEMELGRKVKPFAVIMALRRHAESIKQFHKRIKFDFNSEIILKTNLCDICVVKSPKLMENLKNLYSLVNFDSGDTLNISQGNYEISIVTNEKYKEKVLAYLKGEKILGVKGNLVSISLRFPSKFFETPGVIFEIIRHISWENINIYEAISTNTELTLVISEKDAVKAYKILQQMVEKR
jgi:aspartokinase